jgi:type III secretion system YseE family protein
MSERRLEIVELDERLSNDPDGQVLRKLQDRLIAGKARISQEMDRGVSTAEYTRLSCLAQAYDAGIEALPELWAAVNET